MSLKDELRERQSIHPHPLEIQHHRKKSCAAVVVENNHEIYLRQNKSMHRISVFFRSNISLHEFDVCPTGSVVRQFSLLQLATKASLPTFISQVKKVGAEQNVIPRSKTLGQNLGDIG